MFAGQDLQLPVQAVRRWRRQRCRWSRQQNGFRDSGRDQDFRALLGWWSGFGSGRPRGGPEERGGRPDFKVRLKEAEQVGGRTRVRMGPALIIVLSQLGYALLHGSPGLELFPVLLLFVKKVSLEGKFMIPHQGG